MFGAAMAHSGRRGDVLEAEATACRAAAAGVDICIGRAAHRLPIVAQGQAVVERDRQAIEVFDRRAAGVAPRPALLIPVADAADGVERARYRRLVGAGVVLAQRPTRRLGDSVERLDEVKSRQFRLAAYDEIE